MLWFQAVYCVSPPPHLNICEMCELLCVLTMGSKTTDRGREVSDKFLFSRELKHLVLTESVPTTA